MAMNTVERELVELEQRCWQAIKDRDVDAAMLLTDWPCIVAGATGVARVDRKEFKAMMQGAAYTLHDFERTDVEARLLTTDVAVLAYRVHEDLTVDGKCVSLDASDASKWIRRNGRWVCALHSESLAGDPFGRDRRFERDGTRPKTKKRIARSFAPRPEPKASRKDVIQRVLRDPIPPGGPKPKRSEAKASG